MSGLPDQAQKFLSIKEVAEITALPPATIRYYDQQFEEFLGVQRGAGRRRMFSAGSVERIKQVRRLLKEEGLSIRQARQRLEGPAGAPAAAPAAGQEIEALRREVADLKAQVRQLKEIQVRTIALVEGLTNQG